MSKKARNTPAADGPGEADGPGGPSLAPNPELEAALRDAVDSVDLATRAAVEVDELEIDVDIEGEPKIDIDAGSGDLDADELRLTDSANGEFIDEEMDRIRDELIEAQDKHLRLQAEFENFRKRALRERTELLQYGHENLVKDLLSTVDNLERAIEHTQQSDGGDLESLLQGVELLQRELHAILERHAVSEIEAMGGAFDPALHEAMAQVPDTSVAPNTVIDVLQKGYQLHKRLLRPSRVVVAKQPDEPVELEKTEIEGGETG